MPKIRMMVVACMAVLACGAVVSASASAAAPGWMVNGKNLTTTKALATTAAVDEVGILKFSTITITCKGGTLNGVAPILEPGNMASASSLEFTECQTSGPPCSVVSTIKTEPILGEATLEGSLAVVATLKPRSGTKFTNIDFIGTECALEGLQPVTGQAKVLAPTGQDERTLQLINAISTETSGELKVASSPASLKGSALLKLQSGEPWSFL